MRFLLRSSLVWMVFLLAFPVAASGSEFLGMDANGNLACDSTDMMQEATAGDVGTTKSIRVFIDDVPAGVFGHGCTFCVTDKEKIGNATFTYTSPTGWTNFTVFASDTGTFPIEISEFITDQYPDYKCWSISAYDFTFQNAVPANTPYAVGTLQYQVADEGCIQWVLDGPFSAVQTTGFSTLYFEEPGETCDTVPCPTGGEPLAIDPNTPACPIEDATLGAAYPAGVIFTATGGTPPYQWSQSGLPSGMNINTTTGEIYGTPTASGGFAFLVTVEAGGVDERACSLFVREYGVGVTLVSADTTWLVPPQTISHDFEVRNTGNVTETFYLTPSSLLGMPVSIVGPTFVNLGPGQADTVELEHQVQAVACPVSGTHVFEKARLFATNVDKDAHFAPVEDADTAVVGIGFGIGVDVSILSNSICGMPGTVHPVAFEVENTGECPETFDLQAGIDLPSWSVSLPGGSFVVLAGGASSGVTVNVSIPGGALCTETAEVTLSATGRVFEASDADTATECVQAVLDGTLSDENNQVGAPGDTVWYCFEATNNGNCAATFDLWFPETGGWDVAYSTAPFFLEVGQMTEVCVGHVIPGSAQNGDHDELCAYLMPVLGKDGPPSATVDSSCVTTTAGVPCESTVDVVHTGTLGCTDPGATVRDTFSVENTGDCEETFDFSLTINPGWSAAIVGDAFALLDIGQSVDVYVDVTVPAGALCTDVAELRLQADGRTYGASDFDVSSLCVNPVLDGTLSDEANQTGAPGDTVDYQFTVTNTGNCRTAYQVSFTALWGKTSESVLETLDPGDTAIVDVGHIVPESATEGDKDKLCALLEIALTKGARQQPIDESCVLTTAVVPCDAGVDVYGDTFLSGYPGDSLYADFFVENIGGDPDRYILAATCAEGWFVEVVGAETTAVLVPGQIQNVEVLVVIPEDALCDEQAMVELTAFSFCDPSVWDAHSAKIGVNPFCATSVTALTEDSTGTAGQSMEYVFRVTNEGNCDAEFFMFVSQFPSDWDTTYGETFKVLAAGESYDLHAAVTIPPDAETGNEHHLRVCAECWLPTDKDRRDQADCDSTITRVLTGCVADQPILSLGGYRTISYTPYGLWTVEVQMKNNGPGKARSVAAEMHHDLSWLLIPDRTCNYPDLGAGESSYGGACDGYTFDLRNYPGGSFNVWFDVTYTDTCGMQYQVRLDPTFLEPEENGLPGMTPARFVLHQNIPNPFNPTTAISFELPAGAFSELVIYNTAGQVVKRLWTGHLPGGLHTFLWEGDSDQGSTVPSGTYFYSLKSGGLTETKRMVLIR